MENQEINENKNELILPQNEALQLFNLLELLKRGIVKTIAPGITPADASMAVELIIGYQKKITTTFAEKIDPA
jgi:hypothetical protein